MAIVRYDPFQTLTQMQRDINQLFDRRGTSSSEESAIPASDWTPAVDIKEDENHFVIHADVPGVKPDNIEVTMEHGVLTIKGNRSFEEKAEGRGFQRIERVRGTFLRRFTLPDTADEGKVTAKTRDGVLEVTIPKREKAKPKRISVQG